MGKKIEKAVELLDLGIFGKETAFQELLIIATPFLRLMVIWIFQGILCMNSLPPIPWTHSHPIPSIPISTISLLVSRRKQQAVKPTTQTQIAWWQNKKQLFSLPRLRKKNPQSNIKYLLSTYHVPDTMMVSADYISRMWWTFLYRLSTTA